MAKRLSKSEIRLFAREFAQYAAKKPAKRSAKPAKPSKSAARVKSAPKKSRSSPKTIYRKSTASRKTKSASSRSAKVTRTRTKTKIYSKKYDQKFIAREVKSRAKRPAIVSRKSDPIKAANKLFSIVKGAAKFKKGEKRKVAVRVGYRSKGSRKTRYFSSLVEVLTSEADLYAKIQEVYSDMMISFKKYGFGFEDVRVTDVDLVEYDDA